MHVTNENTQEEPQVQGQQDKPELETGLDTVSADVPAPAGAEQKKPLDITKLVNSSFADKVK